MKRFLKTRGLVILLGGLVFTLISCTKKRKTQFAQGDNLPGLYLIENLEKSYSVKTKGVLFETNYSNAIVDEIKTTKKMGLTNYPVVKYDTEAPYFNDVYFRGEKNNSTNYQIQYRLKDNFYMAYKRARKSYIPWQETTYGIPVTDEEDPVMEIPLFGIPVTYINVEKVRDGQDNETHILREFVVNEKEEATHVRLRPHQRVMFKAITKNMVLPKSFFDGDWFYSYTLLNAKSDNPWFQPGTQLNADFSLKKVSRIKFDVLGSSLKAKNTNIDSRLKKKGSGDGGGSSGEKPTDAVTTDEDVQSEFAFSIPISFVDYRQGSGSSQDKWLREDKVDGNTPNSPKASQFRYIQLNIENLEAPLTKIFGTDNVNKENIRLDEFYLSDNYIGFTLFYPGDESFQVRLSLKRAHKPVTGKIAWDLDKKIFGFFDTEKNIVSDDNQTKKESQSQSKFLNRFYPESTNGKITYYYSNQSPLPDSPENQLILKATEEAFNGWKDLFAEIGIQLELIQKDSDGQPKRVPLGDIRYNTINIVKKGLGGTNVMGYGPSVADSASGEIISATSNLYIDPLLSRAKTKIRTELFYLLGVHQDLDRVVPERIKYVGENICGLEKKNWSEGVERFWKGLKLSATESLDKIECVKERSSSEVDAPLKSEILSYKTLAKPFSETFAKECPDLYQYVLKNKESLLEKIRVQHEFPMWDEKAMELCAHKMIYEEVKYTLTHELGHNFGLRHNFAASSDQENIEEGEYTASVMDYLPLFSPAIDKPGPYDRAAIKWAYSGRLPVKKGLPSVLEKEDLPIEKQAVKKEDLITYALCTDEDVPRSQSKQPDANPFCIPFDWGQNPVQVAQYFILQGNTALEVSRKRLDLQNNWYSTDKEFGNNFNHRYLIPLGRITDKWKLIMEREEPGVTQRVPGMSIEEVQNTERRIANKSALNRQYYMASQLISEFLLNLTQLEDRFCEYQSTSGQLHLVPISQVHLTHRKDRNSLSCPSNQNDSYLGLEPLSTSYAHNLSSVGLQIDRDEVKKGWGGRLTRIYDDLGMHWIRFHAAIGLGGFSDWTEEFLIFKKLKPRILDSPEWRKPFEDYVSNLYLKGVYSEKATDFIPAYMEMDGDPFKRSLLNILRNSISNFDENSKGENLKPYLWWRTSNSSEIVDSNIYVVMIDNQYYYADVKAHLVQKLFKKYIKLNYYNNYLQAYPKLRGEVVDKATLKKGLVNSISQIDPMSLGEKLSSLTVREFRQILHTSNMSVERFYKLDPSSKNNTTYQNFWKAVLADLSLQLPWLEATVDPDTTVGQYFRDKGLLIEDLDLSVEQLVDKAIEEFSQIVEYKEESLQLKDQLSRLISQHFGNTPMVTHQ